MYHQPGTRRDSDYVRIWQVMAWCVALAILVPWSDVAENLRRPKPFLTAAQVAETERFIEGKIARSDALDDRYTIEEFVADRAELGAVSLRLGHLRGPEPEYSTLARRSTAALEGLLARAKTLEAARIKKRATDPQQIAFAEMQAVQLVTLAIGKHHASERVFQAAWLPEVDSGQRPSWSGAGRRFARAWLLSLIPAFAGIAWRFRERRQSTTAELLLRPWVFVLAGIFWWYGLYQYPEGPGAIERRFERLKWRFRTEHGRYPDEQEVACLLHEASGAVLTYEAALAHVRAFPELVQVRSRRTVFVATVAATLGAPLNFIGFVTTAIAQSAQAAVPCSTATSPIGTKRADRGTLWGYFQFRAQKSGFDLPAARLKGAQPTSFGRVEADYDLRIGRPRVLSASFVPSDRLCVSGGLLTSPAAQDFDPPQRCWFNGSPVDDLAPELFDYGVTAVGTRGGTRIEIGTLNGEGREGSNVDRRTIIVSRSSQTIGPATGAMTWQSHGNDFSDYRAALLRLTTRIGTVTVRGAARDHPHQDALYTRFEVQTGVADVGVQLETPGGIRIVLQRVLSGLNRVAVHWRVARDETPSLELRLQSSFTLVPQAP